MARCPQDDVPSGKAAILARHAVGEDDRIGRGHDAEVYRLGPDCVLKIFGPHVDSAAVEGRRAFSASLDASRVGFAVPRILDIGRDGETHYAVEERIAGSSLADALPRLGGAARRDALLAYAEAAAQVATIGLPPRPFGEIMVASPLWAESWPDFVVTRAEADLRRSRHRLAAAVDQPERALARLDGWLAQWCARTIRTAC